MAEQNEYTVNRSMQGDKDYERGDTRKMSAADAAPLLATGALSEKGKEPAEREPGVRHTFGSEPTEYEGYTSASGEPSISVSDKRTSTKPAAAKKAEAK